MSQLLQIYTGVDLKKSTELLQGRLDRCLVSSLASTVREDSSILETGTYDGFTTYFAALGLTNSSSTGLVFTIDLPTSPGATQTHHIQPFEIGKLIPNQLKNKVVQYNEDAKSAVPRILTDETIDMFIHDSLHTITHMMYEYVVSRALMPPLSILISDDILWNSSFVRYVQTFECPAWVCASNPNYGIALNTLHNQENNMPWGRQKITNAYINTNK